MKTVKIKTMAAGLLCLGLASASTWAAESIEAQSVGAGQTFDLTLPQMAASKNPKGQAAQTLKGLKNIKASAGKLHLAKAQKTAAPKCDVTVPGCRESMAVPEYKGTSGDEMTRGDGVIAGIKDGFQHGFDIGDFPSYLWKASYKHDVKTNENGFFEGESNTTDVIFAFTVLLAPVGLALAIPGTIIGGIFGLVSPKAALQEEENLKEKE